MKQEASIGLQAMPYTLIHLSRVEIMRNTAPFRSLKSNSMWRARVASTRVSDSHLHHPHQGVIPTTRLRAFSRRIFYVYVYPLMPPTETPECHPSPAAFICLREYPPVPTIQLRIIKLKGEGANVYLAPHVLNLILHPVLHGLERTVLRLLLRGSSAMCAMRGIMPAVTQRAAAFKEPLE